MNHPQIEELVLQSLEHERGGIQVYEAALRCVVTEELRDEWERYLSETHEHERLLLEVCRAMKLDAEKETPGRAILRSLGKALVDAMMTASGKGPTPTSEVVAAECVVLAETKDHLDWELLGKCASGLHGEARRALEEAVEQVEDQEDEHLYHTKGWCRELWLKSLGQQAILPPPEEAHHVKSAIGAARAEQAADRNR